ncbi:MAG: amidohydrolase family protein [Armatimonadota bacterium]
MTLIDTNAYLGHWATRRLHYNTVDGLLALMDRSGITHACVSSASAIMYRNCQSGNEELAEMLSESNDRLIPFATLSPAYCTWEKDLRWCHEVLGAKGVRLYPTYHRYTLADACCHEFVEAAASLGMLISIPQRVEDYRQRHWLIDAPDVNLNEYAKLAAAHPSARFLITNAVGIVGSDFVTKKDDLPANYWVDICRPDVVYTREAISLIEKLSIERIVFGSAMPFNYPEPATLRLDVLQKLGYDVEKIASGNISQLLGLA